MKTRASRRAAARYNWERLKVNFWFVPLIMSLGATLLAWGLYWIDGLIPNEILQNSRFILSGTPGEMRSNLIGIATTTLATAGVVFTLLTLPLSTVVAQYGSRLLRVFLGDRVAQVVLGMFAATFVYCLAAALSIPPVEVQPEAPQITATVGLFLMMATFASLILLIQHVSTMMQAPNIAAAAGEKLMEVVRSEVPDGVIAGDSRADEFGPLPASRSAPDSPTIDGAGMETNSYAVRASMTGYVQYIDPEIVLALAQKQNLVIRLLCKPGSFVRSGMIVALVWPAQRVDQEMEEQIHTAFRFGNSRTPAQDVEYAVNQLVEMAVRAMSPAINDPFTAMTCLDYIGEGLAQFIHQGERGSHYYDNAKQLRLIVIPATFEHLLGAAFDMLRHASCDNTSVLLHMLEVIDVIGQGTKSPEARQMLARYANLIQVESQVGRLVEQDRQLIQKSSEAVSMKLLSAG